MGEREREKERENAHVEQSENPDGNRNVSFFRFLITKIFQFRFNPQFEKRSIRISKDKNLFWDGLLLLTMLIQALENFEKNPQVCVFPFERERNKNCSGRERGRERERENDYEKEREGEREGEREKERNSERE